MKPDCYKCKYRSSVPGSCHSCCKHPSFVEIIDDPMMNVISIFASVGRIPPVQVESKVKVVGHETGIRRGWFNHPYNFDPNWLLECNGFKKK